MPPDLLPSVPTATLERLPPGEAGVAATLQRMSELVRAYKKNPTVRSLAVRLVHPLHQKDFRGEVSRLHRFVRDGIRYVGDVRDVETLQTPLRVLEERSGDCDDKALLLASLLESINHPTRFKAIAFGDRGFSHVLVETAIGRGWLPLETTEPVPMGWYPQRVKRTMIVYNNGGARMHGLGGMGQQQTTEFVGPPLPEGFKRPEERRAELGIGLGLALLLGGLLLFAFSSKPRRRRRRRR